MTSRFVKSGPPDAAWTEQERELLSAARQDRMPAELEMRLREALDLAPPIASPAAARAPVSDAAKARPLFAGKLSLWGALSMLALGAVSYYALTRASSQPSAATTQPGLAELQPRAASPITHPGALGLAPAEDELANRAAAHSEKAATPDQLRIEAELLEGARKALGLGALADARHWLARYESKFTHGVLQPESEVLAIELKVRTGARLAAKTQADHFLTEHPQHPLRDRVRELTSTSR